MRKKMLITGLLFGVLSLAGCGGSSGYETRIKLLDSWGYLIGTIDVEKEYKFDTYERINEDGSHCSITLYFKKDELRTEK